MLIDRTAPVVCEARNAFQVSWAAVARSAARGTGRTSWGCNASTSRGRSVRSARRPRSRRAGSARPSRRRRRASAAPSTRGSRTGSGRRRRLDAIGELVPAPPDHECGAVPRDRRVLARGHVRARTSSRRPTACPCVDDGDTGRGTASTRGGDHDVAAAAAALARYGARRCGTESPTSTIVRVDVAEGRAGPGNDDAAADQEQRPERDRHHDERATGDEEPRPVPYRIGVSTRWYDNAASPTVQGREHGDAHDGGQPAQVPPAVALRSTPQRPVPQVHPVRQPAQVRHRRRRRAPGWRRCRLVAIAAITAAGSPRRRPHHRPRTRSSRRPRRRASPAPTRARSRPRRAGAECDAAIRARSGRRSQHREQRAGERLEDAAVGTEVGAVAAGGSPTARRADRRKRRCRRRRSPRPRPSRRRGCPTSTAASPSSERPDEIELLLDRQRPHVLQRAATPSLAK